MKEFVAAATAFVIATGSSAFADSFTINGDTTGEPTWNRPVGDGPTLSGTGTAVPYQTVQITITEPLSFSAEITAASFDSYLHLYQGSFDPNAQLTNLVAGNDDGGAGLLSLISASGDGPFTQGQHVVVVSGFNNGNFGTYTLFLDGVLLGWGPTLQERFDDLKSTAITVTRLANRRAVGNTRLGARTSFAMRDQKSPLGFDGPESLEAPVVSTKNGKLMGNVYAWAESAAFLARDQSDRDFSGIGIQFGADVLMSENILLGFSAGYDELHGRTPTASTDGEFLFAQPYLGYRSGLWSGELSLIYGASDYDQTSVGGVGTADSDVWSLNLSVARDIPVSNGIILTPMASASYGEEEITGKTGTLAGSGTATVDYSELSVGARWTRETRQGMTYAGLHADYVGTNAPTALAGGVYDPEGFSGRVELGGGFPISRNSNVIIGVETGGIGTSLAEYSGQVQVGFNF